MSYGRVAAVFQWALGNYQEFDAWCCTKNIDPLELPAYRFYNLALYALKEGMSDEQLVELEKTLLLCDSIQHPLHELGLRYMVTNHKKTTSTSPNPPEERQKYVPPWWRGESVNAKMAMVAMQGVSTLPKMQQ